MRFIPLIALLVAGCHPHVAAKVPELIIPRQCIVSTALDDKTECHGPDEQHLVCTHILITKLDRCGLVSVAPVEP